MLAGETDIDFDKNIFFTHTSTLMQGILTVTLFLKCGRTKTATLGSLNMNLSQSSRH